MRIAKLILLYISEITFGCKTVRLSVIEVQANKQENGIEW